MFEEFTDENSAGEWGLAAAIFVSQTRRRTRAGPTYGELFAHLLPDSGGLPAPFPNGLEYFERRSALFGFRKHVAIEWRRRAMIGWETGVARSLKVGRAFRLHSRQHLRNVQRTR